MVIFKILLIVLVAAPVLAISFFFYLQVLDYIRGKNREEKAGRRR